MGKMKEQQLELFFEDISPEQIALEDSYSYYDVNPDWNDLGVVHVTNNNTSLPEFEISLEEFDTMVAPLVDQFEMTYTPSWQGVTEAETRDYIMWEETKPLTTYDESDMLRKEIQELNATLYKQYQRVAELTQEVNSLKQKLEQVTSIHTNTRKF